MENSRKGIILHDYFRILGGGERLVGVLARHFGWPVLAGFKSSRYAEAAAGDADPGDLSGRWIQDVFSLNCYQGLAPLQIVSLVRGFRDRAEPFLRNSDTVLYSGTYAPLGVFNSPARANIYYCHSPARFVYDQRDFYLSAAPVWRRIALRWLIQKFQPLYEDALAGMDTIVANSENVRQRLASYLGLDAVVVHPPCDTKRFFWQGQSDFYLSTARLDPLKRVDIIVDAFKRMPEKKLVVISGGSEEREIRKMAGDAENIEILGWVSEEKLCRLMGECIASVYIPIDEDFGMSPVESMAAGKPVIGVQEGGVGETVGGVQNAAQLYAPSGPGAAENFVETPRGVLLKSRPGPENLVRAVQWMSPQRALEMRRDCERRARQFDSGVFLQKMAHLTGAFYHPPHT
ncbi:MAG: glycosyltransferase [Desulfosalsimonadaceae bacterium]